MIDPASDLYQIVKAGGPWFAMLGVAVLFGWQEWRSRERW
jgi:hypothetical protein